jgi:hypothetical protein
MPGGYVVLDNNDQAIAYIYCRANEAEAMQTKVLTTKRGASRPTSRRFRMMVAPCRPCSMAITVACFDSAWPGLLVFRRAPTVRWRGALARRAPSMMVQTELMAAPAVLILSPSECWPAYQLNFVMGISESPHIERVSPHVQERS